MADKNTKNTQLPWRDLAFAIALVERMYPNFSLFCEAQHIENAAQSYRNILDLCWQYISGDSVSIDFEKQMHNIDEITPSLANYDSFGVYPANDACVALMSLMEACNGIEPCQRGVFVRLYASGINQYLEFTEDENDSNGLLEDSKAYCAMLDEVLDTNDSRKNIVQELKNTAKGIAISNIGIAL